MDDCAKLRIVGQKCAPSKNKAASPNNNTIEYTQNFVVTKRLLSTLKVLLIIFVHSCSTMRKKKSISQL